MSESDSVTHENVPTATATSGDASRNSNEQIAIVGMACRFPGAPDLATFWQKLLDGANCAVECPSGANEGRVGELYNDTTSIPSACRYGAFLTDIDQFDAEFFRISPSEAEFLDPQQRMMLETSWQALENANIDPESLRGSSASVFAGMSNNDYRYLILNGADLSQPAASLYTITGTSLNTAIGRVSYALGFEGPAMTVDTACSSSLVAMHQAAIALRSRETDVALAGGVQLILSGKLTELRANAGMLSPDGTCKTFDEAANGYVRGEGCGIVALKRLSDAERDGDHIWAVVASTAINQDGTSDGLTVPRGSAQKGVIEAALEQAQISPTSVDYLEAHGTGTPVGDPIEINAAAEVYGKGRAASQPLLVGSVKTNIGHLEPAAGVAGVIKAALAMKFGVIPRHLNFNVPSSAIAWDELPVRVVDEITPWPHKATIERHAGINSFGFSGTNAHVILQGHSSTEPIKDAANPMDFIAGYSKNVESPSKINTSPQYEQSADLSRSKWILPISGKSPTAIQAVATEYLDWIDRNSARFQDSAESSSSSLLDFTWTASVGRSHFNYRRGIVLDDWHSLVDRLTETASLETVEPCATPNTVAFAYTGQGSQWIGMGKALYDSEPAFRDVIDRCEEVIQQERDTSLIARIFGSGGAADDLEDPKWVQPSIYAIECALTDLWGSIGVTPSLVLGHSLGEIAAARTAGIFTLEDGCRFASARGRLMSELPGPGLMAAVFLSEAEIESSISAYNDELNGTGVSVAAQNGAHQVVSGYTHELEPLLDQFEQRDIRVRRLKKSPAYHSALVEPILAELGQVVANLKVSTPQIPLISNLTGELIATDQLLDSEYWQRHARGSVAYRKGVASVAEQGVDAVLEIGPNAILGPMTEMAWPETAERSPIVLASLRAPRDDRPEIPVDGGFHQSVCEAYQQGLNIRFQGLYVGESRRKINIPGYAFQRRRHWVQARKRRLADTDHVLLGTKHETPYGTINFETEISPNDPNWLQEHLVFGQVLVPGAFFGSMGFECSDVTLGCCVEDLQLHNPMMLKRESEDEDVSRRLQLALQTPDNEGARPFEIFSRGPQESEWLLHATGIVTDQIEEIETSRLVDIDELTKPLEKQDITEYYKQKSESNIQLGTPFRNLRGLWSSDGSAVAEIRIREEDVITDIAIQPLLLDACFQVLAAARESANLGTGATYIPFGWDRMTLYAPFTTSVICHAQMHPLAENNDAERDQPNVEALSGDLWIYNDHGRLCGQLQGLTVKRATRSSLLSAIEDPADLVYEVEWQIRDHVASTRERFPLAKINDVETSVEPFFDYLVAQGVSPEERYALLQDLERLAHSWVATAFDRAGFERVKGAKVRVDELIAEFGVLPIHEKLVRRMLRILTDAGILENASDGEFVVIRDQSESPPNGIESPEQFLEQLLARHPHGQYELTLLSRFGTRFLELLTGKADPLALLFDDDESGAADFYRTAPVSAAGNQLLGDAISRIVSDLPDDRTLRVVEVGAGTGATTEIVFAELAEKNLEYTYTDISAGFFAEAERNFAGNGVNIDYCALDIENDPQTQGFEDGSYDIVVAANVLHATQNLLETLINCRKLLAPGGVLVALESLRGRAWQDLTFGFLDGWWRYNDPYRKDHALASPDIWRKALSDAGYVDSVIFGSETVSDTSGPLGSGTIVAQTAVDLSLRPGTWVVERDQGGLATRLVDWLESLGQNVIVTSLNEAHDDESNNVVSHIDLAELIEQIPNEQPLRGVVHLIAVEGNGVDARTDEIASDIKHVTTSALSLTQALIESGARPSLGITFVTRGAQVIECEQSGQLAGAALWGFGKVVELESSLLSPRMIDLDPEQDAFDTLIRDLVAPDAENHIAYRNGSRFAARLVRSKERETRVTLPSESDWIMQSSKDGSLLNVHTSRVEVSELEARYIRIQVEATGLNFSDVLVALGAQVPNASLGLEFSGYVTKLAPDVEEFSIGQRVVGMGFGTFGTQITTHASLVAAAPEQLMFNELATIPIVFTTAAIGFELANLKPNDRVLVHSAAGGVGLAAIQLIQAAGAEVIATASSTKHDFLRSLGIEHIFDSRQLAFGDEVLEVTNGEGVDVVLNSLTSEGFIDASLNCLRSNGRFIEIGRLNILSHEEMGSTRPDVDYHILALDELKREEPDRVGHTFRALMARFGAGELSPLRHSKWPLAEIGDALQYMGSARHVGKLVLTVPALTNGSLRDDRTYLITGGLGGIGCAVANWLVERGAKHIVLNGRREPDEAAVETIAELRTRGTEISVKIADMTQVQQIDSMLSEIHEELPPLGGLIHSVGVLSDGAIPNQTWSRFEQVLLPKVVGAWRLHEATQRLDLDFFVLFSSATGVLGNAGQANHAAANAFLDQLAAHRRALGLPAQSIAWGAWSDIGEAAEQRERITSQLETTGTGWISPELGIRTLDYLVSHDITRPAAMSIDWRVLEQSLHSHTTFLSELLTHDEDEAASRLDIVSLDVTELRASDSDSRSESLMSYIQNQLQSILRLPSLPSRNVGFFELGMDSLMAVELRNRLIRAFEGEITISRTVVFDHPDVETLAKYLSSELEEGESAELRVGATQTVSQPSTQSKVGVIGIACRFPGSSDYTSFWRNLERGKTAISECRADSANWQGVVGDSNATASYLRHGGFVDGIDKFDARFFGIRPIEARSMDPRQRMLLETTWEAIENAGIDPTSLRGARVGLYIGLGGSEYRDLVSASGYEDSYLGTSGGMTTGRISYVFGLTGPAMSFDLACASSLVSIHEGIKALQQGEVDLALVGGANAILSPAIMRFHRELGLLAPNGKCTPFDENAEGYVRGEGCGVLVLKRIDDAVEDGDPIWATLLGSAVNQNGASAGLTIPNGTAQEQVMLDAVARAGVNPIDVDFLETHATGLSLSDPIEIRAASSVYTSSEARDRSLLVGSVKSHLGHLEWAAGVAGVIKLILSMAQRRIPAQTHLSEPNQEIDWETNRIEINRSSTAWPERDERSPIGAVSAFGMSGTNSHVLIEGTSNNDSNELTKYRVPIARGRRLEVPFSALTVNSSLDFSSLEMSAVKRQSRLLPLSGKTTEAVVGLATKYVKWLDDLRLDQLDTERLDDFLADVAWTACTGRSHFDFRVGVPFNDLPTLLNSLQAIDNSDVVKLSDNVPSSADATFIFDDDDECWLKFGHDLYDREPIVRTVIDQINQTLLQSRQVNLLEVLSGDQANNDGKADGYSPRVALFATQIAISMYWRALGIQPSAIVGSASHRITASCIAGSMSLEEGIEKTEEIAVNGTDPIAIDDTEKLSVTWIDSVKYSRSENQSSDFELPIGPNSDAALTQNSADYELLQRVSKAYELGLPIELEMLFAGETRSRLTLPNYSFDKQRFWFND